MTEQISNKELAEWLRQNMNDRFPSSISKKEIAMQTLAAERLAAMADICMKREVTQYKWSCGCVSCVCDTDIQCLGCGATSCRGGNCQRKNVSVEAMPDVGEQEQSMEVRFRRSPLDGTPYPTILSFTDLGDGIHKLYAQPQQTAPDNESNDVHEHLHNTIALLTKQLIKAERQSDKETIKRYCLEFADYLYGRDSGDIEIMVDEWWQQQRAEGGE